MVEIKRLGQRVDVGFEIDLVQCSGCLLLDNDDYKITEDKKSFIILSDLFKPQVVRRNKFMRLLGFFPKRIFYIEKFIVSGHE